jgi:hypothetical protein
MMWSELFRNFLMKSSANRGAICAEWSLTNFSCFDLFVRETRELLNWFSESAFGIGMQRASQPRSVLK